MAKATEQKLTERTLFTHYGTIFGTLEYMGPEQAELGTWPQQATIQHTFIVPPRMSEP